MEAKFVGFGFRDNETNKIIYPLVKCFFYTLVTAIFMYFQLIQYAVNWHLLLQGMGWIVLFSLTNSFGEEAIFRVGMSSNTNQLNR
jgi:membrane protease YdiL (CAAX protease family)